MFFGRQICARNNVFTKYDLNKRCVLGPTTLDNDLAFLMANMAQVAPSHFVLDPFCGTGGILVALSHFRPQLCFGNDMDLRVLKGWRVAYIKNTKVAEELDVDKNIFTNFAQYQLKRPEIVVSDNARHCWRQGFFDAIVTDPPYGIRASAKKVHQRTEHVVSDRETYCTQRVEYDENEIVSDLLQFASQHLRQGGRLVYLYAVDLQEIKDGRGSRTKRETVMNGRKKPWWPETTRDPDLLDESRYRLPEHPNLALIGASLQVLSSGLGRLLVTMERVR